MKAATRIRVGVIVLALLLLAFADYCWITAESSPSAAESYFLGDAIFKLGWPLTQVIFTFPDWAGRDLIPADHVWAVPLVDILFITQWLVWAQLIIWLIHRWKRVHSSNRSLEPTAGGCDDHV
jgi:hypothetical protein